MKCKQCGNEFESKRSTARFCTDVCRQQSRRVKQNALALQAGLSVTEVDGKISVTPLSVTELYEIDKAGDDINPVDLVTEHSHMLQHYRDNPDKYVPRREPEKMNWGEYMDAGELAVAGLKCNRVSIPGDWDYKKVG